MATKETRFILRCLRQTPAVRRRLQQGDQRPAPASVLASLLKRYCPLNSYPRDALLAFLAKDAEAASDMEVDKEKEKKDAEKVPAKVDPEASVYVHLLVTLFLLDTKKTADALQCARQLVMQARRLDNVADHLSAKCWFYYGRAAELAGCLPSIRSELLAAERTASLRHMDETKATLLNLLLRDLVEHNLFEQADKLVSKSTQLSEQVISTSQYTRYLYYQGKIRAIELDYTAAFRLLQQALRKTQQVSSRGFHVAASKLSVIVQLLLGDIPERSLFSQRGMRHALRPYLDLTNAVRVGDLGAFRDVVDANAATFRRDNMWTLIARLRHNVIKAGLRKICAAYSRISLEEVAVRLRLDTAADCEFIIAKAIRDGIVEASIDHAGGYVRSKENLDVYATAEPRQAFARRIAYCLNIHDDAVRAMRYAPEAKKQTAPDEVALLGEDDDTHEEEDDDIGDF
eukprot:TRINITY_DN362_c2_g1_i1.p1 TRINITY_DN362_c2_g1~~TRINITY_DN362_c2_g1_i1.p1  ORF type:complete len:499 (-),score=191.20 TRINITY_DN362_c2_g1_i1:187-1560(-)